MKKLIILSVLLSLGACSSLTSDPLMEELNRSQKADQARMKQLGLEIEDSKQLVLIDEEDRYLLMEDFDCSKSKVLIAYCQN